MGRVLRRRPRRRGRRAGSRSASAPSCCSASPRRRTRRAPAPTTTTASSSSPCAPCGRAIPDLLLLTDVCLCEYTSHGHCGVIRDGEVANDESLELIARTAVSHAEAGADAVCPSDMMDGRVGAIRAALDDAGLEQTPIVSYAAKYASAFYGPFREAAESAPSFGDRRGYQMDPANVREALRELERRRGRGRRRPHGQAGAAVPRRDPRGARALRPPDRRVQRLRRVRDGQGRGRAAAGWTSARPPSSR